MCRERQRGQVLGTPSGHSSFQHLHPCLAISGSLRTKVSPWSHPTLLGTCPQQQLSIDIFSVAAFPFSLFRGVKRGRAAWTVHLCPRPPDTAANHPTHARRAMLAGSADANTATDAMSATRLASRAKSNISPAKRDRLSPAPRPLLLTPLSSAIKMFSLFEFALLSW